MNKDAVVAFAFAGLMALYIAVGLKWGRLPSRGYWLKRSEHPNVFWALIVIAGLVVVGFLWFGAYLAAPWPPSR
jgi:hypothetical protein